LEQNPWGYYGKYNPEKRVYSIVNVVAQQEKEQKKKVKETKHLNALVKKGKMTQEEMDEKLEEYARDHRDIFSGRNCRKGWGVSMLLKIGLKTLKFDFPSSYRKNDSETSMLKLVKKAKYLGVPGTKTEKALYTKEEISELSRDDLRRALYWVDKQSGGYLNNICKEMEKWFRTTKWEGIDMLVTDKQAGTKGGHKKKEEEEKDVKTHKLRIEKIIPAGDEEKFKTYLKDIQKLMNECFAVKKYTPDIDDKIWVMVFSRKKLVGFVAIDQKNVIHNVCVATNYRRRGIAQPAIQSAVEDVCSKQKPRLLVDNLGKNYKKLIKLYTLYGFTLVKNDGKTTTMEFKCK